MNCPECDNLTYQSMCSCGWKMPAASTIQIKKMGADESSEPLEIDKDVDELLQRTNATGKERAKLCVEYMKAILRGKYK